MHEFLAYRSEDTGGILVGPEEHACLTLSNMMDWGYLRQ